MVFWYITSIVLLTFIICYLITFFTGGWFTPVSHKIVREMMEAAKVGRGDLLVDLGSGDGRIVMEAARRGAKAVGYEINPFLWVWSNLMIQKFGLSNNANVHLRNFWNADLSRASVASVFLPPQYLTRLANKLGQELPRSSRIVTFRSPLSGFKEVSKTGSGIYLYRVTKPPRHRRGG